MKHGHSALVGVAVLAGFCACDLLLPTGNITQPEGMCGDAGQSDGGIDPENYDHACMFDSDCMTIAVGSGCDLQCETDAINVVDRAQYECDRNALLSDQPDAHACPACFVQADIACCVSGFCAAFRGIVTCTAQAADASTE